MLEIERKFLANITYARYFINKNNLQPKHLTQTYLEKSKDKEIRVRMIKSESGISYTKTVKLGNGLIREENEYEISEEEYNSDISENLGTVVKIRYYMNDDKDCIDYYPILRIATFEAEFESEEEALAFDPEIVYPGLTVKEISGDSTYSNLKLGQTQLHLAKLQNLENTLK